mmetsp:Transcript_1525/g.5229  ORF Transcript_1525/g.5229 Transcript_1525/m.5229 type:complete len:122 (+) Transcript_1525:1035-1400(+)
MNYSIYLGFTEPVMWVNDRWHMEMPMPHHPLLQDVHVSQRPSMCQGNQQFYNSLNLFSVRFNSIINQVDHRSSSHKWNACTKRIIHLDLTFLPPPAWCASEQLNEQLKQISDAYTQSSCPL